MSNLATDPVGVILGEAVSGTTQERFQDMVAIASVIANRAKQLGTTPQNVVAVRSQFNAYNKALPPGASRYRNLAEQAWSYVQKNGPIHNATYYATPAATKNLPSGLQDVGNTKGHVYFSDPQGRAVKTAAGLEAPREVSTPSVGPTPTNRPSYTPFNNLDDVNRVGGLKSQWGKQPSIKGVTVHHTGGHLNPKGTVGVLNQRGLGAHFVVDRQGVPHMIAPPGAKVGHMRNSPMGFTNANTLGIEVDAKNDRDVTPEQVRGTLGLIDKLTSEYPGIGRNVFGHGVLNAHKQATEGKTISDAYQNNISRLNTEAALAGLDLPGNAPQIANAAPTSVMGSGDNLEGGAWGPTAPAPAVEGGAWGRGVVGRAPLGPVTQPAPSMPVSAALNPTRPSVAIGPSATSFAPPSTADLAAAYGQMGSTMQEAGVNRLGTMPTPNMPVAMPQPAAMPQAPAALPQVTQQQFPAAPAMPSVPRSLPTNAFPSRPVSPPQADFMGNIKGADQFGNTTVTNKYGVTTGMTPQGKQTAYGTGTPGPLGRTSLFGDAKLPGAIGRALPGLLGGLAGAALLGPAGGLVGGLIGQKIGQGINMNSFPSAPSTVGETKGKALSKSERSSISPSASRSMSKNGGRMTGLW